MGGDGSHRGRAHVLAQMPGASRVLEEGYKLSSMGPSAIVAMDARESMILLNGAMTVEFPERKLISLILSHPIWKMGRSSRNN